METQSKPSSLQRKFLGIPIFALAMAALFGVGVAAAALTMTFHGSVEVVSSGGGGDSPPTTYTFKVYDAETAGAEVTDSFFALGQVNTNHSVSKTVYIENTGTGAVAVTASVSGLTAGTMTGTGTAVDVPIGTTRIPLTLTFTAPSSPAAVQDFDVTFTGNP